MMLLKSFFRRIYKDFRHKELLPLKMIFFVQASTLFVLYPYLTIHMRELGINVEETAIMSAVTPFVAIVMPPLAGLIADKIGNFKVLLSLFSSLGGAAALLLLLVPVGRITVKYPTRIIMDLGCSGSDSNMLYTVNQDNQKCEAKIQPEILTNIESCGYVCHVDFQNRSDLEAMLLSNVYTVNKFDVATGMNNSVKYSRPNYDFLPTTASENEWIKENRRLRNNEYYKTSIRQLSRSTFYFPTPRLYDFACSSEYTNASDFHSTEIPLLINETKDNSGNEIVCTFKDYIDSPESGDSKKNEFSRFRSKIGSLEITDTDKLEQILRFSVDEISQRENNNFHPAKCRNYHDDIWKVSVAVPLVNLTVSPEPYKTLNFGECSERCIITAARKDICSNMQTNIEYNISMTFWLYLGIRVFIGIISGTAFAMFEGAVIAILREQKADYGLQRIYGSIGGMISSPLSGMLIDYASSGKEYTDFRPAFYLYAALKIASGVLMLAINLEFKSPANNVVGDVISVLKNIEIAALLLACFVLGTAWGYIESFLFWLIQDLGGSRSLMGITITVGGITGIPLLVLSGPIINRIGHANVLVIGFFFYAVRLVGYSLIYNPWLCLIFEALESVTASLSFTAAVTYAAKLSTTTTDTSIQGLLGGLYYGVGRGCGSLIGGYLMKAFGTRPTYRILAGVTLITGIIYFSFNIFYLRKQPQVEGNDIVKRKPKKPPVSNGIDNPALELNEKSDKNILEMNESTANATDVKIVEAVNNAKNLDIIERHPELEKIDSKKAKSGDSYRQKR